MIKLLRKWSEQTQFENSRLILKQNCKEPAFKLVTYM